MGLWSSPARLWLNDAKADAKAKLVCVLEWQSQSTMFLEGHRGADMIPRTCWRYAPHVISGFTLTLPRQSS